MDRVIAYNIVLAHIPEKRMVQQTFYQECIQILMKV